MPRPAVRCPRCATPLGWERTGGVLVLHPRVAAGADRSGLVSWLKCPDCGALERRPNTRPVLAPVAKLGPQSARVDTSATIGLDDE